jgi:predicted CoA-binding protein
MVKRETVNNFLSLSKLAVVGVSRTGKKFGNSALKGLRKKGYTVYPVNANADEIEGEKCYNSLNNLPEKVDGAVVSVPPEQSDSVVKDALSAGIKNVWLQQGAESKEVIKFCTDNGMNVVYGQCIFMFAEPAEFFHRAHKWVKGFTSKLPK